MNEQNLAGWVRAHYYAANDFTHESRGSLDRFRPARLNASGLIDGSMVSEAAGNFTVVGGALNVGDATVSTATTGIDVGHARTGSGYSYIDLIGDTTYSDFGLRLIRGNAGANAVSEILHRGTGMFSIRTYDAAQLSLYTNSTERFRIDSSGNVAVRHASGANLYITGTAANVTSALSLYDNGSTLKGRFIYTGSNSAGNRYVGIINDAADYIGLVGHVRASAGVNVGGDSGGVASTLGLTNAFSGVSTGTGTVKMNGATSRNSVGWVKMYNGTTAIYLPYWTVATG